MPKQFQELKQQLAELSDTINKFESEAVQLRIIELLFQQVGALQFGEPNDATYEVGPARSTRTRRRDTSRTSGAERSGGATPSASGAVAALSDLIESDFFQEKRTIGDIVRKCEENFNVRYKSNAFSGPLSRYAKKGILKREKNEDGNYVYFK